MAEWNIYRKDGSELLDRSGSPVTVHGLSYNGKLMGEEFVTVSVKSPVVIDWAIGDRLYYRGRTYVLSTTPSVQKQARVKSVGNAIIYDSVKFSSLAGDEMTRCEFRDIVLGEQDGHYNFAAQQFAFHCVSLIDFSNRVKANLMRMWRANGCKPEERWRVFTLCVGASGDYYYESLSLDDGEEKTDGQIAPDMHARRISNVSNHKEAVGKKGMVVNISSQKVWDALQNVKDVFDVNFVVQERCIFIGSNGHFLDHSFSYGKSNDGSVLDTTHGLFKIERSVDDSQAVVTRLRAYGSEKNMPSRYYQNSGIEVVFNIASYEVSSYNSHVIFLKLEDAEGVYTSFFSGDRVVRHNSVPKDLPESEKKDNFADSIEYEVDFSVDGLTVPCGVLFLGWKETSTSDSYTSITFYTIDAIDNDGQLLEKLKNGNTVLKAEEGVASSRVSTKYKRIDPNFILPNNMAVQNLMLPGFGFKGNSLKQEVERMFEDQNEASVNLRKKLGYDTFADFSKHYRLSEDPTDPYIEAIPQVDAYGVREESVTFSGGGEDDVEVYPSIEYMMGLDENDETLAKVVGSEMKVEDGGIVEDSDTDKDEYAHFTITIPSIVGLDINKCNTNDSAKISMLDGKCGGMDFDISGRVKDNGDGTLTLTCVRSNSQGIGNLYYPYRDPRGDAYSFDIRKGDRFVLIDLEMPKAYVDGSAMYALLPAAIEFLDKNRDMRYKYSLEVDSIHLARQHDEALEHMRQQQMEGNHDANLEGSIYWTMKAGDLVAFSDADLGIKYDENGAADPITGSIMLDSIEIKEAEGRVPKVTIQLVDEVSVGTLQAMQKQIDGIVKGTISVGSVSGGAGYSAGDIQRMIRTFGGQNFLSKLNDDTANGNITFANGITVNDNADFGRGFVEGSNGARIWQSNGSWHAQFDFLHITKKATFSELEIQSMRHIGGAFILSAASCTIDHVEVIDEAGATFPLVFPIVFDGINVCRCYFLATDGEKHISNDWMVGDQVTCKTFNLLFGSNGSEANHYWWRKVLSIGTTEDGMYHWFDVSAELRGEGENVLYDAGSDLPMSGDECMLLGHQPINANDAVTHANRGNAIIIDSAGEGSPYFRSYRRIGVGENPYSLEGKVRLDLNAENPRIDVSSLTITTTNEYGEESTTNVGEVVGDSFEIYCLDVYASMIEDETGAEVPVNTIPLGMDKWPDVEEQWTPESYYKHADPGDVAITNDGIYYRFQPTEDGDSFEWVIITDTYLIQSIRQSNEALQRANEALGDIADMADDELITPDEKLRMKQRLREMATAYTGIVDECGTFGVSPVALRSAYNLLVAFMEWIVAQPGTTKIKDGSLLLGIMPVKVVGSNDTSYDFGYYAPAGNILHYTDYLTAVSKYNEQCALVRKNITNGVYSKLSEIAIEGGYDENIANNVNAMFNVFSSYVADQTSDAPVYRSLMQMNSDLTYISNWSNEVGKILGSGIVTEDNYAAMFSTAKDENGNTLAESFAQTYVSIEPERDEDGNIILDADGNPQGKWISGYKIKASEIIIETDNFGIDKNGDIYVYGSIVQKPKYINKDNFLSVMDVLFDDTIPGFGRMITYDYDFMKHSGCVIFEGDLTSVLPNPDRVYIQLPGCPTKKISKFDDKFAVVSMIGNRVMIVNKSNVSVGANMNGSSAPIPVGSYAIFVLTRQTENDKTIYRWVREEYDSIDNIQITS